MLKYTKKKKKAKGLAKDIYAHPMEIDRHSLVKAKGEEGRGRRRWAKQEKGESPAIMSTLKKIN